MERLPAVRFDISRAPATLEQVIALGDQNNKTLGFLPFAGFRAAAAEDRIAICRADDGTVLGYCLFDLPRDVIRIVHVCVGNAGRGLGLARALVDAVGARHADRLGMVLKCRADWDADKMWPHLGFVAQTQVPGRSAQRLPLTVWWRSHGHADLFTLLEEHRAANRTAAIDSNIFCDLHSAKTRQGSRHTAVLAPLIADDELSLVLLPALQREIYQTNDAAERARFLNAQVNYTQLASPARPDVVDHLVAGLPAETLAKDASLLHDASLIAEAHANAIDLFITRDRRAIQHLTEPASDLGVDVLHPTEVPTYLDVEHAGHSYRPVQLAETTYAVQRMDRPLAADEVGVLLSRAEGERLTDFHGLLADLAARSTTGIRRHVLVDGDGGVQAAWALESNATFDIHLLRVARGELATTLASQLAQKLRAEASSHHLHVIRVRDPRMSQIVRSCLEADGFTPAGDGSLAALTLPVIGAWSETSAAAQSAVQTPGAEALLPLLELPESPSLAQTVEFERVWSPAKILGQGVLNYLVPIKPAFASDLLGYPPSLMSRSDALGLSREHVYYSSLRGQLRAPARVLWYVSGKYDGSVVATSKLVEVRSDTPKRLHRSYGRLGVWKLSDIERAARSGRAIAFRFADTEVFQNPVGLERVRALAPNGRSLLLRSASLMDDEWYARIYRDGVCR